MSSAGPAYPPLPASAASRSSSAAPSSASPPPSPTAAASAAAASATAAAAAAAAAAPARPAPAEGAADASDELRLLLGPAAAASVAARLRAAARRSLGLRSVHDCVLVAAGLFAAACIAAALALSSWAAGRAAPSSAYITPYERACKLFCEGPVLRAVQTAHLFEDGKHFVDMPAKRDPQSILASFARRFADPARDGGSSAAPPSREALAAFVAENFDAPGSDMLPWVPADHVPMPARIARIRCGELRLFAVGLHDLWLQLGRVPARSVQEHPERHSLLYLPHPAIVPGGRFRETYAWDTYWILRGLFASNMLRTARGMVDNLVHLVQVLHFVPNGGRAYYALPGRSQPPLLSRMIADVFEATSASAVINGGGGGGGGGRGGGGGGEAEALSFLAASYPALAADYAWWMQAEGAHPHSVSVQLEGGGGAAHVLARYVSDAKAPRPESYTEDLSTAAAAGHGDPASAAAQQLFGEIAAAAETGWDFSSRWLANGVSLATSATSLVVPADLNAFLLVAERDLAHFAALLADEQEAACVGPSGGAAGADGGGGAGAGAGSVDNGGGLASSVYCRRHPSKSLCRVPHSLSPLAELALEGARAASGRVHDWHARKHGVHATTRATAAPSVSVLPSQDLPPPPPPHAASASAPAPVAASAASASAGASAGARGAAARGAACKLRDALHADAVRFAAAAAARAAAIEALMWDEAAGQWRDLLIVGPAAKGDSGSNSGGGGSGGGTWVVRRSALLAASNFLPLWALGVRGSVAPERADAVAAALNASGLVQAGGVLTSGDESSGQQWDAPNAWAPLQHLLFEGLNATGRPAAVALAERIAKRWLKSSLANFLRDGFLNEKNDGRVADGLSGRGGEYPPQLGFGWSIGVALDLLTRADFASLDEVEEGAAGAAGRAGEAWVVGAQAQTAAR